MSKKLEQMTALFTTVKEDVTKNIDNWQGYLETASRLYKYSFDDQVAIHAQRPDATACATMELWNGKMNRWVKSGAKGIALMVLPYMDKDMRELAQQTARKVDAMTDEEFSDLVFSLVDEV